MIERIDHVNLVVDDLSAMAEFYEQDGRLATETALIDDNGDGQGTPAGWFRGVWTKRRARDGASPVDTEGPDMEKKRLHGTAPTALTRLRWGVAIGLASAANR